LSRRRVRALARGGFEIRLPADERHLLAYLPGQLAQLLAGVSDVEEPPEPLRRLFPPAYVNDEPSQLAYETVTRGELSEHHRRALEVLVETAQRKSVTAEELEAWLVALNDLRLVLGTTLGVTEDAPELTPDDPRVGEWAAYGYLSYLLGEVVDALSGQLPPPVPESGDDLPPDPWGEPLGDLRWDGTPRPGGDGQGVG